MMPATILAALFLLSVFVLSEVQGAENTSEKTESDVANSSKPDTENLLRLFTPDTQSKELPKLDLKIPKLMDTDILKMLPLLTSIVGATNGRGVKQSIREGFKVLGDQLTEDVMTSAQKETMLRAIEALPAELFDFASVDLIGTIRSAIESASAQGSQAVAAAVQPASFGAAAVQPAGLAGSQGTSFFKNLIGNFKPFAKLLGQQ